MATVSIPFEGIEFHAEIVNPRDELRDIDDLIASIKSVGLQMPLIVLCKKRDDGERGDRYYLAAGFRRHEAIRRIRADDSKAFEKVEVRKFKGSIAEAQVINLVENIQRSDLSPVEVAAGVDTLINLGYKREDVAKKVGKSISWVNQVIGFRRNATPQLKDAVKSGNVSFEFAKKIAAMGDEKQRETVAEISSRVEGEPGKQERRSKVESEVLKNMRESSGRPTRPAAEEIRGEIKRLESGDDEFETGIRTALLWVLGEKKTLRKPSRT